MSNEFNAAEQARSALSGLSAVTPDVSSVKSAPGKVLDWQGNSAVERTENAKKLLSEIQGQPVQQVNMSKTQLPEMTAEEWMNQFLVSQFSMAQRRPASMAFGGHYHLSICPPGMSVGFEQYDSYPTWYSAVDAKRYGQLSKEALAVRDIGYDLVDRMCQMNPAFVSDVKNAPTLMEAERRCMPLTTYAVSQYKTMSKQSNMTPYAIADSIAKDAAALRYEDAYFVQDMVKMEGPVEPADPGYMTHKMFDAGDLRAGRMRARSLMNVCPALKQYDPDGTLAKKADVVKEAPQQTDVKKKSGFYHSVKERLFSGRKQGLNEVEQPSKQTEVDSEFY